MKVSDWLKVLVVILSAGMVVVSGLYIDLNSRLKEQGVELGRQREEFEALTAKYDRLAGLPELYNVTKGKWTVKLAQEHKLQYTFISEANKYPQPERYYRFDPVENSVIVFYTPLDNVTLQVYLTIRNLPEDFYLPFTLQKGNALLNESGVVFHGHDFMGTPYFKWQSPVFWSKNVTSLFGWIEVEIPTRGWYTLSLTGPVKVSSGGSPSVDYMWGERDQWLDIYSIYVNANCKLLKNGEPIYFAIETHMNYGSYGYIIEYTEAEGVM